MMQVGRATWFAAFSLAALQLQLTTGRLALVCALVVVGAASLLHRRRLDLSSAAQVLTLLGAGACAVFVHGLSPLATELGNVPLRAAAFAFAGGGLAVFALRLNLARPEGGDAATAAAGGLVFLGCGTVKNGPSFPLIFGAFVVVTLAALSISAWERRERTAPWRTPRSHALALLFVLAVVPAGMWVWSSWAPRLYARATAWVMEVGGAQNRAGFADGPLRLDGLDGLLDSDEIVLRAEGETGERLRGNVYVEYRDGRWWPPTRQEVHRRDVANANASQMGTPPTARYEYVNSDADRFFLPLAADRVALTPADASIDGWGIVRAQGAAPSEALVWAGRRGATARVEEPRERDLRVPDRLVVTLNAVANELAGNASEPAERLRLIEDGLRRQYIYSLDFKSAFDAAVAGGARDPIEIFLTRTKRGHCEYFASALALLARHEGFPARLLTGYLVTEHNPLGDYAVVRERHAHAWVEVHLPEIGWVALDATPADVSGPEARVQTSGFEALWDSLAWRARRHGRWALLVGLTVGLAAVQIVRIIRARQAEREPMMSDGGRGLPALDVLLKHLASAGISRADGETLESLARRLRRAGFDSERAELDPHAGPAALEAADLLLRYAAHRYGDVGSAREISTALASWSTADGLDAAGYAPKS